MDLDDSSDVDELSFIISSFIEDEVLA